MAGEFSAVPCAEEHGTAREDYDNNQPGQASVVLRCAWSDRNALMTDLLTFPRYFPYYIGVKKYAFHCTAIPAPGTGYSNVSPTDQACLYTQALVSVQYGSQITDIGSESIEPTIEYDVLDHRRFKWVAGGSTGVPLLEGEAPPLISRSLNIMRTKYRMAAVPPEMLTCIGKVNDSVYTSLTLGLSFAAETLLFQPQSASQSFTTAGTSGFTISFKFSYKANGWNKFWRTETQSWSNVYIDGGSQYKPYTLGDFAALFA